MKFHSSHGAVAYDINKQYTHILKTCDAYGWSRFALTDGVKGFTQGSTIDTGMYFVVTDMYFPLKGNGWYFDDVVEKAIGYNLIKR